MAENAGGIQLGKSVTSDRLSGRGLIFALIVSFAATISDSGSAQVPAFEGLFQANSYTTGLQHSADIAMRPDGSFILVWASDGSFGTDASDWSVQARRFDLLGVPLGDQFQVNQYTTGRQAWPRVAATSDSGFLVVWHSYSPVPPDDETASIQGRWFGANGDSVTDEIQLNFYTTGAQYRPDVAIDSDGNATVVWSTSSSPLVENGGIEILARRFGPDTTPLGPEFGVNSYTSGRQSLAAVGASDSGEFVVAWESGERYPGVEVTEVRARRFASSGSPLGSDFVVNSYTGYYHLNPAIGVHEDGSFLVTWPSWGSLGSDSDEASIQGRWYLSSGAPAGDQFQVNSFTTSQQTEPSVAVDSSGRAIVAWKSLVYENTTWTQVVARRLEHLGTATEPDFLGSGDPESGHLSPSVAADANGDFVVAWRSMFATTGTDPDGGGIFGQRFDGLFRDGFESGSSSRWSAANP
jgi:hypothetical protein